MRWIVGPVPKRWKSENVETVLDPSFSDHGLFPRINSLFLCFLSTFPWPSYPFQPNQSQNPNSSPPPHSSASGLIYCAILALSSWLLGQPCSFLNSVLINNLFHVILNMSNLDRVAHQEVESSPVLDDGTQYIRVCPVPQFSPQSLPTWPIPRH